MNNLAQSLTGSSKPHIYSYRPMDTKLEPLEVNEHDEFGETVFYELSPVAMTLYYSSIITD